MCSTFAINTTNLRASKTTNQSHHHHRSIAIATSFCLPFKRWWWRKRTRTVNNFLLFLRTHLMCMFLVGFTWKSGKIFTLATHFAHILTNYRVATSLKYVSIAVAFRNVYMFQHHRILDFFERNVMRERMSIYLSNAASVRPMMMATIITFPKFISAICRLLHFCTSICKDREHFQWEYFQWHHMGALYVLARSHSICCWFFSDLFKVAREKK